MALPSSYKEWCKVLQEDPAATVHFARAKLRQHKDVIRAGRSVFGKSLWEMDEEIVDVPMEYVATSTPCGPFPFSELPPEIRNRIYQLALVHSEPIGMKSKYCLDFNGCSIFQSRDSEQSSYSTREFTSRTTPRSSTKRHNVLTTYTVDRDSYPKAGTSPLAYALLSVNRQIRNEAVAIFYGENTFRFESMNALVPFLQDRSPTTLKLIKSLQLVFRLVEPDLQSLRLPFSFNERPYCADPGDVATICSDLSRFNDLNLRDLSIILDDRTGDFDVNQQWVQSLIESVNNLDALGIAYHGFFLNGMPNDWDEYDLTKYNLHCSQMEKSFWNYMAPRMLRRTNDQHHPDTLEHRNIRNREFMEMLSAMDEEDSTQAEAPNSPSDASSIGSLNVSVSEPSLD